MKALSIRQPYAWLILHGHKDVEYRSWLTHYRGPFLVHVTKAIDEAEVAEERSWLAKQGFLLPDELPRGGIIGVAKLVDCVRLSDPSRPRRFLSRLFRQQSPCGDQHKGNCYGFILGDPRPLPFREVRGRQRFFNVRDDLYGPEFGL